MLSVTSTNLTFKTPKVLHMIHPKDKKNPTVLADIELISCDAKQIICVGEHLLVDDRFNSFETVVVHRTSPELQIDMLNRLRAYLDRFKKLKWDKSRRLVVYGNTAEILPSRTVLIRDMNVFDMFSVRKLNQVNGLGILTKRIITDYNPENYNPKKLDLIKKISDSFEIYLLDATAVLHENSSVTHGNMYKCHKGKIISVKEMSELEDEEEVNMFQKRVIPPIKALYKKDDAADAMDAE